MNKSPNRKPVPIEVLLERYTPVPEAGCWLWTGHVTSHGYGGLTRNRVVQYAHRFFYTQLKGPITDGLYVCHKCDTRLCVNPDHLFLGTCRDNLQDMSRKGRHNTTRGEKSGRTKLTDKNAMDIFNSPLSKKELAASYGVTTEVIRNIKIGETWAHLHQPTKEAQ